jgi:hypothetical protein
MDCRRGAKGRRNPAVLGRAMRRARWRSAPVPQAGCAVPVGSPAPNGPGTEYFRSSAGGLLLDRGGRLRPPTEPQSLQVPCQSGNDAPSQQSASCETVRIDFDRAEP